MKYSIIILSILLACIGCNNTSSSQTEFNKEGAEKNLVISENTKAEKVNSNSSSKKSNTNNQEDWYWQNTQMSENNTFESWEHGAVDLFMLYRYRNNQNTPETLEVGSIDENGKITIKLPENIQTETKLGNLQNLVFYDIQDISKFIYTIPEAGYFGKTTINVMRDEATIGTLTLGNSVRVTYNLTNQSTLSMGDEGYIISWVYLDKAARMQGTEKTNNTVRRDGTKPVETENTVMYDLEYKPGWNFVKTEVIGKYDLVHERGLNATWFKKHEHTVISEIPKDANYFFRRLIDN